MASKPSVTLTFAGDEEKLTAAMDRVGAASKQMSDKVDKASDQMKHAGKSFDDLAEKSDTVDTRAMGFRDTVTGLSDSFKGLTDSSLSTEERLLTLGMGVGDLASGFTNLLFPAMQNLATFMKGGLSQAMTFVSSHPLLITLGLLAAAFVVLWTNSETFRKIVIGVMQAVGGFIKDVFLGAINGIVAAWNGVIDWFANLPGRIGSALGSLGNIISGVFKGAVNMLIDGINWGIRRINDLIHGINWVSKFVGIPAIPDIPQIARLHTGIGEVPGAFGQEKLAILEAGETVTARGQDSGAIRLVASPGADSAVGTFINTLIRKGHIRVVRA